MRTFYKRRLPHWQPNNATFAITSRLNGSIPMDKILELKEEYQFLKKEKDYLLQGDYEDKKRDFFLKYDNFLDSNANEPYWLREPFIAELVDNALKHYHGQYYNLWAYCIMPNHVHFLISTYENAPELKKINQNWKKYTARKANEYLNRTGKFWQEESYDRVVRDEDEFWAQYFYILNNPVKAGFVKNWEDWKWTYSSPDL